MTCWVVTVGVVGMSDDTAWRRTNPAGIMQHTVRVDGEVVYSGCHTTIEVAEGDPPEPEGVSKADAVAEDLGHAAGRKLSIREMEDTIEEAGLTRLEQYELALSILTRLNYDLCKPWQKTASRDAHDE